MKKSVTTVIFDNLFRIIVFAASFFVSAAIMLFCFVQLYRGIDSNIYMTLISLIIGTWLPSPGQIPKIKISSMLNKPDEPLDEHEQEQALPLGDLRV